MRNLNVQLLRNAKVNFILAFFSFFVCTLTRIINYAIAQCFLRRATSDSVHRVDHAN